MSIITEQKSIMLKSTPLSLQKCFLMRPNVAAKSLNDVIEDCFQVSANWQLLWPFIVVFIWLCVGTQKHAEVVTLFWWLETDKASFFFVKEHPLFRLLSPDFCLFCYLQRENGFHYDDSYCIAWSFRCFLFRSSIFQGSKASHRTPSRLLIKS